MPKPVEIELLMVDKASAKLKIAGKEVDNLRVNVKNANKDFEQTNQTTDRLSRSVKRLAAAFTFQEVVRQITSVRGEFQQLEVSFKTMLGNAEEARQLMSQLTQTAATTPFQLTDIAQGAKQLLAYGFEADKVNATLLRLGDIASGLSIPLGDLVYLYGTTKAQGRMFAQDLMQFTNRGIPMISELAKQFGIAESEVKDLVSAGKVGFPEVQKVIESLTAKGSKFGGLMEAQSKTIVGQISNIKDSLDAMLNDIGKANEGIINDGLQGISYMVKHYEQFGRILLGLTATYGTYRTAVMLVTAAEGAENAMKVVGVLRTNLLTKAQALLNATMLANPYVLVATALGALVAVMLSAKTETERMKEANEAYEEDLRKVIAKEEEHRRRLEELATIAENESLATNVRREALNKLEKEYPQIFAKYDTEYEKLQHIKEIKLEIAKIEDSRSMAKPKNELKEVQQQLAPLEKKGHARQMAMGDYATYIVGRNWQEEDQYKMLKAREQALQKTIQKNNTDEYFANLTGVSNEDLAIMIRKRQNLLAFMATYQKKYGRITQGDTATHGTFTPKELQFQINRLRAERNQRNVPRFSSAQLYKEAKTNYAKALKAYNSFVQSANNSLTKTEFAEKAKQLKEELNTAKKTLDKISPIAIKQKKKSDHKDKDEILKAEEKLQADRLKLKRRTQDLRNRLEQSEIDNMEEGEKKRLRQIELNHTKERQLIERQREETLAEMAKVGGYSSGQIKEVSTMYDSLLTNAENKDETARLNELLTQYKGYFERRKEIEQDYEQNKKLLEEKNAPKSSVDELSYQKDQALAALDEAFAQRQEGFTAWANQLTTLSLNALRELLAKTEQKLSKLETQDPQNKQIPILRTKVRAINQTMKKGKHFAPDKKGLESWKNLTQVLGQVREDFNQLGLDANSSIGKMLAFAGTIATSTTTMISGIQKIGTAAFASLSAMQKASVILGVISAALQVGQALSNLFGGMSAYDKLVEKYNKINALKDQMNEYRIAITKARMEEEKWFSQNNLLNLKRNKKLNTMLERQYTEKLHEVQMGYRDKGSLFSHSKINGLAIAKDNLRVQTRHRTWFRTEKSEDLPTYLKKRGYGELFRQDGLLNKELAKYAVDKLHLLGNTKDTLEKLLELQEQYEEYQKQLREYVNNLYEPLVDNFTSAIWDNLQSGKDALDSFKEYAADTFASIGKDMIKSLVLSKIFGEGENSYQAKMAKLYDKFAQDKLTKEQFDEEIAELTQGLMDAANGQLPIIQDMAANFQKQMQDVGIEVQKGGGIEQHGKAGGFMAMTQDQGTKLEGMFTSGLQHWASMDEHLVKVAFQMNNAEGHLQHIEDHTAKTVRELKDIKEQLATLKRDGVKMQ